MRLGGRWLTILGSFDTRLPVEVTVNTVGAADYLPKLLGHQQFAQKPLWRRAYDWPKVGCSLRQDARSVV